jgi:hypothetical protein
MMSSLNEPLTALADGLRYFSEGQLTDLAATIALENVMKRLWGVSSLL